ncbi:MAG: MFS transporter [Verrucomicrobiota bacterium]
MTIEHRVKLPWCLAWRISVGQIVSWGILYYAFTVVVGPMQAATGWSRPFLNAGLSLGLLTWGICAFPAGVWIQRRGGRGIMTLTSVVGGGALALIGFASTPGIYLVAWILLGAAMAGVLYEPAFAVVTAYFGPYYRRGITLVTLVGGLASTAFIPLAQLAVEQRGWRDALISLGVLQTIVCAPLYFFGIPRHRGRTVIARDATAISTHARVAAWWIELRRDISDPRFFGLALWFTAHAATFSGLIFQLVPILQNARVPTATTLQAIALIGPMQVLGRLALATWGKHLATLCVGGWAMLVLGTSLALMLFLHLTLASLLAFAVLYGASNGVMTILRGTAIAELFGRERYAELNGALSLPAVLAKAASPFAVAALWTATERYESVFAAGLAFVVVGVVGLRIAKRVQSSRELRAESISATAVGEIAN